MVALVGVLQGRAKLIQRALADLELEFLGLELLPSSFSSGAFVCASPRRTGLWWRCRCP